MTLLHRWVSVVRRLLRLEKTEHELDLELQSFIEMSVAEKVRSGMSPSDARREALLDLGGMEQVKERVRTYRHGAVAEEIARDFRYALRRFANNPGFVAVIVVTLALGIGANTAIFSLMNSIMLKSLPVREPEQLVAVAAKRSSGILRGQFSNPVWEQIRDRADFFDGAIAYSARLYDLSHGGETRFVTGLQVNGGYFDVLGVKPTIGRVFSASDDRNGCSEDGPRAVLSYAFWQSHYSGAEDVIGKALVLNGRNFTIIGVSPPYFSGVEIGQSFDVAVPLCVHGGLDESRRIWLSIIGRLKPGVSREEAEKRLIALQPSIRDVTKPVEAPRDISKTIPLSFDKTYFMDPLRLLPAPTGSSRLREEYAQAVVVLMIIAGLVLLVTCGNIASLLLARAASRTKEIAVRVSIGASRGRLVRQLLIESVVLSLSGALLGLLLALPASRLLVYGLSANGSKTFLDLSLDWRVLAFTTGIGLATGLLFGILPAIRATHVSPAETLREMAGTAGVSTKRTRAARWIVSFQMALSLMLVIGAALFLNSFWRITSQDHGFKSSQVLLIEAGTVESITSGISGQLPQEQANSAPLYSDVLQAVRGVPGVQSAAYSFAVPVGGSTFHTAVNVDGYRGQSESDADVYLNLVSPGYFETLGTALVAGRDFDSHDARRSNVAIVNRAFARKFLGDRNPVGTVIGVIGRGQWIPTEIVGLVQDAKYSSLREQAPPTIYQPAEPRVSQGWVISVKTSGRAASSIPAIVDAISKVNKNLPLTIRTFESQIQDALAQERLMTILSAFFGVLALIIAAVGLAGLISYSVNRRQAEIGIRAAMGASSTALVRLVMRDVIAITLAGVLAGVIGGIAGSRFLASMLYEIQPSDPATFGIAAIALVAVAGVAGYIPARRAARIDPMECLRSQ